MTLERWQALMQSLNIGENTKTHQALVVAYAEKHRRYHTAEHINATLKHLDSVSEQTDYAIEIETALWFHDAIYKPFSSSNELDSVQWASRFLRQNGVAQNKIEMIHNLIMATLHTSQANGQDQMLMVDIDLTILGSNKKTYQQFEKDVRYEYKRVPYFLYRKKRKDVLSEFLNRPKIFRHDYFHEGFEAQAKDNLRQAIDVL